MSAAPNLRPLYTRPPMVPDELLTSPLPDWVKMVWLAIRKVQGDNPAAFGSHAYYAERCGKSRPTISNAMRILSATGWIESLTGRRIRCMIGCMEEAEVRQAMTDVLGRSKKEKCSQGEPKCSQGEQQKCSQGEPKSSQGEHESSQGEHPSESRQGILTRNPRDAREGKTERQEPCLPTDPGRCHTGSTPDRKDSPAVAAYYDRYPGAVLDAEQTALIQAEVKEIDVWRDTLIWWRGQRYRPSSIPRIIERYHEMLGERAGRNRPRGQPTNVYSIHNLPDYV